MENEEHIIRDHLWIVWFKWFPYVLSSIGSHRIQLSGQCPIALVMIIFSLPVIPEILSNFCNRWGRGLAHNLLLLYQTTLTQSQSRSILWTKWGRNPVGKTACDHIIKDCIITYTKGQSCTILTSGFLNLQMFDFATSIVFCSYDIHFNFFLKLKNQTLNSIMWNPINVYKDPQQGWEP